MLKEAFGEQTLSQATTFEWFKLSEMAGNLWKIVNILVDRPRPCAWWTADEIRDGVVLFFLAHKTSSVFSIEGTPFFEPIMSLY